MLLVVNAPEFHRGYSAALAHFVGDALSSQDATYVARFETFAWRLRTESLSEEEDDSEREYRRGWNACRRRIASALGVTL